ncbi:hypothetical protein AX16_005687 [Volvariella volvacea WC 439]|nr:hypothetical protein AX16_005687 [Volvariella volvacea WC 439]
MTSSIAPLWNKLTGTTPATALSAPDATAATTPSSGQHHSRTRQPSGFDAGLNSSNAWTTDHKVRASVSCSSSPASSSHGHASAADEDEFDEGEGGVEDPGPGGGEFWKDGLEDVQGRPARALYAFQGKPEFRELSVDAGDVLEILKEEVGDGWSLARVVGGGGQVGGAQEKEKSVQGEVGLLPRSYYTFTAEFTPAPELEVDSSLNDVTSPFIRAASPNAAASSYARRKEASTSSVKTVKGVVTGSGASVHSTDSTGQPAAAPIVPQNTGEWRNALLPNFRQSLLGGKSLNRFSSFVTSGAEEWVLKGSEAENEEAPVTNGNGASEKGDGENDQQPKHQKESTFLSPYKFLHSRDTTDGSLMEDSQPSPSVQKGTASNTKSAPSKGLKRNGISESDRHFVDVGPAWKEKVPPFKVMVHSPSKRSSVLSGAYTIYSVTSLFRPDSMITLDKSGDDGYPTYASGDGYRTDIDGLPPTSSPPSASSSQGPIAITVQRRFSHFVILHTALAKRLPGIALPPLPEKQYAGRFSDDFVEARRGDLERYIGKIVRHPVARYAEIVTFFLSCESESEWKRMLPKHLAIPPAGPAFYARVFHPAFNLDAEDAEDAVERFDVHTKAVSKGVQGLRNIFGRVREARIEMSKAERLLSYSLLSLITSKLFTSAPLTGIREEDEEGEQIDRKSKGLMNDDGAWCWRDDCKSCLGLTKALQKTSETLQSVADLYDDHARRRQLATHESLKGMAHPSTLYEPVITTHRSTLKRYHEAVASSDGRSNEEMAARCETVLNTTMAEMETYHSQKVEDFATLAKEHLDGEIEFYEQVLYRLKAARAAFEPDQAAMLAETPRVPSIYERELETPRLNPKPLLQPCPHVFDSAPMRPVSVAIHEGVNMLLGPSTTGRGSVFGKFW